jgi:flagellar basal body rod protein FlgC
LYSNQANFSDARASSPTGFSQLQKIGGLHRQEKTASWEVFFFTIMDIPVGGDTRSDSDGQRLTPLNMESVMIPSLNASVSALHAFEQKLGVTAANIANVNTDGYKKYRAVFQEGQYGAVEVTAQRAETGVPLGRPEEGEPPAQKTSNVALEEEFPELITSVYGFKANLKALKAQDEMLGHLLDTVV